MQFIKITKIKLELLLTELSLAPEAPSFFDKHVCPLIDDMRLNTELIHPINSNLFLAHFNTFPYPNPNPTHVLPT